MRFRYKIGFLISILLHAVLLAYLVFSLKPQPKTQPALVEFSEVKSEPRPQTKSGDVATKGVKGNVAQPHRAQKQRKGSLALNPSTQGRLLESWQVHQAEAQGEGAGAKPAPPGADPMESVGDAGQGWSHGTQYANAMDVVFTNENLGFFQSLHRKVDSGLVYPDDFVHARITGKVHIEAVLSKDGRLIDVNSMKADNDILHAYSLALLLHVLKTPLPERSWLKAERAVVVFDFHFKTRMIGDYPTDMPSGTEKNRLVFGREGTVDPYLAEKLTELFTHYVPPIVPLPGGFYVDLVLAYQYVKNVSTNAPLESDVRMARIKRLQDDLVRTIHHEEEKRVATPAPSES